MSTSTLIRPDAVSRAGSPLPPIEPIPFGRLVRIEMRKATDTRSGKGVFAMALGLILTALIWKVTQVQVPRTFDNYGQTAGSIAAFIVPVIGLLAMTSERSQRTALTTFTLAPRRGSVLSAKLASALALSAAVTAMGLALAGAFTALGGAIHGGGTFEHFWLDMRSVLILVLLQVVMASAFGALTAHTPSAIFLYVVAPIMWGSVGQALFRSWASWLDVFATYDRLASAHPWDDVGFTLTSIAAWVVLPATIGAWRWMRREVK